VNPILPRRVETRAPHPLGKPRHYLLMLTELSAKSRRE